MQFDFQSVIDALNGKLPFGDNFSFQNSRTRVVPGDYLFNTIMPQELHPTYNVAGGTMRIYPTMVGQMPMDTPPPPIGAMEATQFNENTTKIGGQMHFPEARLRELQNWASYQRSQGVGDGLSIDAIGALEKARLVEVLLGFSDLLLKAQLDTFEWLRGQALTTGGLSWNYNKLQLTVDYGVPSANKITRTGSGNSYYGTTSKFWTDIRFAYTKLNNFKVIMNSQTYYSIIDNSVNSIAVIGDGLGTRTIVKAVAPTAPQIADKRDRLEIVIYDKSGSVINKSGTVQALPFLPNGKIIIVGEQQPDGFELTQGSTPDPTNLLRLGYTHIAPTVEGGRMGIWSRVYTPEAKPYQLLGETVANGMPVILNPNKVMILTTDMP